MSLLKKVVGGEGLEKDLFHKIYQTYYSYIYRYLYGLTYNHQTAEDLTQETFVKALSVLQFPNESIKSWLLTVSHNLYVDYVRKNGRIHIQENSAFDQIKRPDFTEELVQQEISNSAFLLIKKLPENQRQAVLLCLVNEVSYQQAGEILGISKSAITNLIFRARKTLRELRRNMNES